MDFVSEDVATGTVIRMLMIVDDCTRECEDRVDTSLVGLRVRRVQDGWPPNEACPNLPLSDLIEDRAMSPVEAAINVKLKEETADMRHTLSAREEKVVKMP